MAEALELIHQAVRDHDAFLLVAHKDADADSLGSALAFADYLEREGKQAYPWVPDPRTFLPARLRSREPAGGPG